MKEEIIEKFKDKKLGIIGFKEDSGFYLEDFLDRELLMDFIMEMIDHQTDLTKEGYNFLEEYYGIDNLAKMIEEEYPDFSKKFHIGESTLAWLKTKGEYAV